MAKATKAFVLFIALEHIGFLILEMFLWTSPTGLKIFKLTPEFAEQSAALAANQGLYNGFLAAGLIWAAFSKSESQKALKVFFLSCVFVAGAYGWYSISFTPFLLQSVPAGLALALVSSKR